MTVTPAPHLGTTGLKPPREHVGCFVQQVLYANMQVYVFTGLANGVQISFCIVIMMIIH